MPWSTPPSLPFLVLWESSIFWFLFCVFPLAFYILYLSLNMFCTFFFFFKKRNFCVYIDSCMIYCSQRSVPQKVLLLSGVTHYTHPNCIKHISYVNKRGTFGPCASVRELLMVGLWHLREVEEVINCRGRLQDIAQFFPLRRMAYLFSLAIGSSVTFSLTPSGLRCNWRAWLSIPQLELQLLLLVIFIPV